MPKGRTWLRQRQRLLIGQEKLLLQGLTPSRYEGCVMNQDQLGKLAREMFNGFAVVVALIAFNCTIDVQWKK